MKKRNLIKLTKEGKNRIQYLLNNFMVNQYHKTLLTGIKSRSENKNLSKSDCDIYETINQQYLGVC